MHSNLIAKVILILALLYLATAQTPTIVVGPVIGYVTNTTARVLFEFDQDATITTILTNPSGKEIKTTKNVTANRAVPFAFDGLEPDTRYTLTLDNSNIQMVESYFTTLSGESGKLRFAVSSCMDKGVQATKSTDGDLWANLLKRIQNNEIDYFFQTGDQVYMDDPFGKEDPNKPYFACTALLNQSTNPDDWNNSRSQCLEFFRDEYRKTWSIPTVREVLAKIPSLTIFDDHEVRDDWGYLPDDTDPTSREYFYGTLARQVYYEYQRQLREDINFDDLSNYTAEYFYLTLNDIGFFFLDYRGVRTWNRPYSRMEGTQLGLVQTELLNKVLDPVNGDFANLNHFFLVSPLTVVFLVELLVHIGYFSNNDAQESWSFGYSDEQAQLLNTLRNWKIAKEGRDLVILDGDVHMGGFTDIKYNDDFAFLQFTTTSIASSAPSDFVFAGFDLLKEAQSIEDPWDYEHHDWTNNFNYGLVMANTVNGAASIQCYLVNAEGDTDDEPEIWNTDGSDLDTDDWQEVLANASV